MNFVLIIIMLNSAYASPGSSVYTYPAPQVAMQEFGSEQSCVFARDVILRRAGSMAKKLDLVCIPKGSK